MSNVSDGAKTTTTENTNETSINRIRLLFRSRDDYMVAGVLGGLAEYWKMDSTILRLLFLVLTLLTAGLTFIAYFALVKAVPLEPELD